MIVMISCCKSKREDGREHPAAELYTSPLFRKSLEYARRISQDKDIYILSAKYGLLPLDARVRSYDVTLNRMGERDRKAWAERVVDQMTSKGIIEEPITILAGDVYTKDLLPYLPNAKVPLKGMGLGMRLKALTEALR